METEGKESQAQNDPAFTESQMYTIIGIVADTIENKLPVFTPKQEKAIRAIVVSVVHQVLAQANNRQEQGNLGNTKPVKPRTPRPAPTPHKFRV